MQSFARIALLLGVIVAAALAVPEYCPRTRHLGDIAEGQEFSFCITPHKHGKEGEVSLKKLFHKVDEVHEVQVHVKDCYEVSVLFNALNNINVGGNAKRDASVIQFLKELDKGVFCKPVHGKGLYNFDARRQVLSFPRTSCPADTLELVQEVLGGTIFQIVKLLVENLGPQPGTPILEQIPEGIHEVTQEQVKTVLDFLAGCVRVYEVKVPAIRGCHAATANLVIPASAASIDFETEKCVNGNGVPINQEDVLEDIAEDVEGFVNAVADGDVDAGGIIGAVVDLVANGDGVPPIPMPMDGGMDSGIVLPPLPPMVDGIPPMVDGIPPMVVDGVNP